MVTAAEPIRTYEFGVFTVELPGGELRKHGTRLKIQERPLQLLVAMLERPGEIVSREELRRRLWPDGTFVDFDHNISSAINKLRTVLNDSASHPRFIETVGRRGYRFLADVKQVSREPGIASLAAAPATSASAATSVMPGVKEQKSPETPIGAQKLAHPFPRQWLMVAAAVLLLCVLAVGYFQWRRNSESGGAPSQRVMLAVLPFENLTGDPSQEYFSDGLTEEMIAELGRLNPNHLGVIARTSVMTYKHTPKALDQIGRELGVQYVIEGSVRRDANHVRITAQLIQVKDQTHLWAREYDRELKNLLEVQGEIAQELTDEIKLTIGDQPVSKPNAANHAGTRPETSYEVYDLYLKGRYFWNKRTPAAFQQAAEYFQQAIDKDPNYAPAYAGLADTYGLMSTWYSVNHAEYMPKAREAALKALALDETLAEAHVSLALIAESYDYDWETAEKEFRRAIQLNPEYATAHQWYAEYLSWQGRFDEAFAESERARQLDPMSLIIANDRASILYYSRQYDQTIQQCQAVLKMDPGTSEKFGSAHNFIILSYVQQGKFAEALEEQNRQSQHPWTWAMKAYIYGRWGRKEEFERALKKFQQLAPQLTEPTPAELFAYLGAPDRNKILSLLEKAYQERSPALTNLKVDPKYDSFRSEPRFQDLLRRLRLAQ